jgi:hypothetical protein
MRFGAIPLVVLAASITFPALTQEAPKSSQNCEAPPTIDCTPKLDCSLNIDTRECNKCLLSLFGHCSVRGNDPACEAAKGAQNAMFSTQKVQCEGQKTAQKAACESTKAALIAAWTACKAPQ